MNDIVKKILKVIGWVVIIPLIVITYTLTLLATYKLEPLYSWAPLYSLMIIAIYTVGVAVRNLLGGLTVSMFIASIMNFFISVLVYAWTF